MAAVRFAMRFCLGVLLLQFLTIAARAGTNYQDAQPADESAKETEASCNNQELIIENTPLQPLEIAPATVYGKEIDENVYRMSLPPTIRTRLVDYCDQIGIMNAFQQLMKEPLERNSKKTEEFGGFNWVMQRPDWFSDQDNLHWLSPANSHAHEEFLQVLGDVNFDSVLDKVGRFFELDSLAVYAVSIHAVSHIKKPGFVQVDLLDTGEDAWNIMIPLLLPNKTEPELAIVGRDESTHEQQVRLKQYEKDVALLMGDDAYYLTTKCDYQDDMMMVATIHIAHVNMDNVDSIVESYNDQPFPPQNDKQWLYDQAGRHWGKQGHQSLPKHSDTVADKEERNKRHLESKIPQEKVTKIPDRDTEYADRFVHGILKTLHDPDCMTREFDASADDFDTSEATGVLRKCKLLVLRNMFDRKFLTKYRDKFARFIQGIHIGDIASTGTTTNSDEYYLHLIDDHRWEVVLPKVLAHQDLVMNEDIMNILLQPKMLGREMVLHSLGSAIAEPGAEAQRWHMDDVYLFDDLFHTTGLGGHDLPSHAVTMMVPLLNMTSNHGPTEFCMGSSFLAGLDAHSNFIKLKDESLRPLLRSYTNGFDKDFCPHWRIPQLNFGDMLLFDYSLGHRGGPNKSPDLRSVLYMTYSREWYKDKNFKRKMSYAGYMNGWTALYEQLTQSARFAIPDDVEPTKGKETLEPRGSLESIQEFIPLQN